MSALDQRPPTGGQPPGRSRRPRAVAAFAAAVAVGIGVIVAIIVTSGGGPSPKPPPPPTASTPSGARVTLLSPVRPPNGGGPFHQNKLVLGGHIRVAASATGKRIRAVRVLADGRPLGEQTRAPYVVSVPWDTTKLRDGTVVLTAVVETADGRTAQTAEKVWVDNSNLPSDRPTTWAGDYETGNLDQWKGINAVPGGVTIVTSPVRQGRYAARMTVRPGAKFARFFGERAEVFTDQALTGGYEGVDTWYGWSTYFPSGLNPTHDLQNIFTDWHNGTANPSDQCGPPVIFGVDGTRDPPHILFRVRGGPLLGVCHHQDDVRWDLGPITYGRWYDFVFHVRWSYDTGAGFVQLWLNGHEVVPRTTMGTMYVDRHVELKQGFYRSDKPKPSPLTSTLYQDAMRRGTSYAAVALDPDTHQPRPAPHVAGTAPPSG